MAIGVICKLELIIARDKPGASFCIIFFVASGVTSLEENPVPPVVKITFMFDSSDQSLSVS